MTGPSGTPGRPDPDQAPSAAPISLRPPRWWPSAEDGTLDASPAAPGALGEPTQMFAPPPVPSASDPAPSNPAASPFAAMLAAPDADGDGDYGWDFEDKRDELFEWPTPPRRFPRWLPPVLVVAVTVVVTGAVWVVVLSGREKEPEAIPPPPPPPPATLMSPESAAQFKPQDVSVRSFEGRLMVSWKLPVRTDGIVGYVVAAQSREGIVQKSEVPRAGELTTIVEGPLVGADSCVVVTTMVSAEPSMTMARSDPICPGASAPVSRSSAPAAPGSGSPSGPAAGGASAG